MERALETVIAPEGYDVSTFADLLRVPDGLGRPLRVHPDLLWLFNVEPMDLVKAAELPPGVPVRYSGDSLRLIQLCQAREAEEESQE